MHLWPLLRHSDLDEKFYMKKTLNSQLHLGSSKFCLIYLEFYMACLSSFSKVLSTRSLQF